MEACFSQLTLDVIGKALFNYDFDALNMSSPVIQVLQQLPDNHNHIHVMPRVEVSPAHSPLGGSRWS